MPDHSIGIGTLIAGFGVVPGSIIATALFAQEVAGGHVDWANLGAVAAIIAMMGFLLTKLLPKINEDNNATVKHITDTHKEMMENQRHDFIALFKSYNPTHCEREEA